MSVDVGDYSDSSDITGMSDNNHIEDTNDIGDNITVKTGDDDANSIIYICTFYIFIIQFTIQ